MQHKLMLPASSCMPGHSNHQVDWIIYWDNVTDKIFVYFHNAEKPFADS